MVGFCLDSTLSLSSFSFFSRTSLEPQISPSTTSDQLSTTEYVSVRPYAHGVELTGQPIFALSAGRYAYPKHNEQLCDSTFYRKSRHETLLHPPRGFRPRRFRFFGRSRSYRLRYMPGGLCRDRGCLLCGSWIYLRHCHCRCRYPGCHHRLQRRVWQLPGRLCRDRFSSDSVRSLEAAVPRPRSV